MMKMIMLEPQSTCLRSCLWECCAKNLGHNVAQAYKASLHVQSAAAGSHSQERLCSKKTELGNWTVCLRPFLATLHQFPTLLVRVNEILRLYSMRINLNISLVDIIGLFQQNSKNKDPHSCTAYKDRPTRKYNNHALCLFVICKKSD